MGLRRFGSEQAAAIAGWSSTPAETLTWCGLESADAATIVAWNEPDDVEGFVLNDELIDDGAPVAYGELWIDDEEAEVELAHLVVRPDARGRGVGRGFVAELAALARQRHDDVTLRVVPENEPAIRSYLAAGFRRASPTDEADWNRGQPRPYVWMLFEPE